MADTDAVPKKVRGSIGAGIAFLFVLGIEQLYNIRSGGSLFSNSVTSIVLFGLAAYAAAQMLLYKASKRTWILSFLAGGFFAALTCFGHAMNYKDSMWQKEAFLAVLFVLPMAALFWKSLFLRLQRDEIPLPYRELSRKQFFIYWGIMFALWIPALLASWPGIYGYDSGFQLNAYMYGDMSSHHPVLHTWLLGITMQLGVWVFHSPQAGALLYTLLQMILLSAMLAAVVYKLQKRGLPRWFCFLALIFYGLHPANSLMALAATKDTLFGGVMVLLVLQILDMAEAPGSFYASPKKLLLFGLNILAALALRNNAFHMLLLFLPFFLWYFRRQWKRAVLLMGSCLALHLGITGPGYTLLGIEPGDPREMCSVLMQTAARAYNLVYLDLTEEEKEGFYTVIAEEGLQSYLPHFADPVKAYFDGNAFVENPKPFLKAWASVGKRYSKLYVDAFLSNTLGYWYPGAALPDSAGQVYLEYEANGNGQEYGVEMQPKLKKLWAVYDKIGNEAIHQKIPVVSFLFSVGTFDWVLLAAGFVVWQKKRYPALLAILPLGMYLCTLFLGPVVKLRYVYPMIVCLPVLIALAVSRKAGDGEA